MGRRQNKNIKSFWLFYLNAFLTILGQGLNRSYKKNECIWCNENVKKRKILVIGNTDGKVINTLLPVSSGFWQFTPKNVIFFIVFLKESERKVYPMMRKSSLTRKGDQLSALFYNLGCGDLLNNVRYLYKHFMW